MQADICLINGRVVNVYSGEILEQNVALAGDKIIYVGPSDNRIGSNTKVIDAGGDFVLPGFFDAHAHADLYCNPRAYMDFVITRGTTGFFNDGHDLANALGAGPYLNMTAQLSRGIGDIYTGVPVASPPFPGIEGRDLWTDEDLRQALAVDRVLSVSEVTPYLRLVRGDEKLEKRLALAQKHDRLIEGHTTGANVDKLNRLAAAGVTSCHESLSSADVIDRLRLGYAVMLRHGSIRQDLPRLIEAVKKMQYYDTSRLMLVTDGIFPDHLICRGNMDWVITEAIGLGIDPVRAIQMATINPARYFKLDHQIGGIAPGHKANLLVAASLKQPTPRLVIYGGMPVAENGNLLVPAGDCPVNGTGNRPFKIKPLTVDAFRVPKIGGNPLVPVIRIVDQTVTDRQDLRISCEEGEYRPQNDVLKIVLMNRKGTQAGKGFVKGFCPGLGGIASTIAHETHGLMIMGCADADMARATNEVLAMDGGICLVQHGEVKARIPLPVGAIASAEDIPTLAAKIATLHKEIENLGCTLPYPLWTLGFLSFTSVLRLRITYSGVFDVKEGKIVFTG
jgi:adenine deaminase